MSIVFVLMTKKKIPNNDYVVRIVGVYETRELANEEASRIAQKTSYGNIRIDIVGKTLKSKTRQEREVIAKAKSDRKLDAQARKERCRLALETDEMFN